MISGGFSMFDLDDRFTPEDEEAYLLLFVTVALCSVITLFGFYIGDPYNPFPLLILLYMGWCFYVAFWGLIFQHKRYKKRKRPK